MNPIAVLVILLLVFGFGGWRMGPGVGYYGGGSLVGIVLLLIVLRLLGVF